MKWDPQLYFQKELLCPELHISRSERYKVMQSQLNITSVSPSLGPGCFLHTFSFTRAFVLCGRRQWHPTPVLLPGKSHGWRSLVGCSPWGRWESDTTERLHFHFSLSLFTFMHWRRKWQPTPVFLSGESHGWRSLVGCSPWGCTESDTTEAT